MRELDPRLRREWFPFCEARSYHVRFRKSDVVNGPIATILAHVPAKWNPVRRQEHAPKVNLRRFPSIWDHRVIPYGRKTL
jgi:hypothetical protein